jgi:hypothetical protein
VIAPYVLALALESPIPLEAGTYWEYRESYTERIGGLDSIEEADTRFSVTHSGGRPFIAQRGGADPVSGPVEIGDAWIRLGPWTGEDALPLPLVPGRSGPPGAPGAEPWRVEDWEDVTVPAGRFRALRCAFRTWTHVSLLWIAPGVGVVKETQGVPGRRPEIERVLVRWGRPSPTP